MSLNNELYLQNMADDLVRFVRTTTANGQANYVAIRSLESLVQPIDEILFQTSTNKTDRVKNPSGFVRSTNIKRTIGVVGVDGKIYSAVLNITVRVPGGNVIDSPAFLEMIKHGATFLTNFSAVQDEVVAGAEPANTPSAAFLEFVKLGAV